MKILATAFDAGYYEAGMTLLASSYPQFDAVYILDLGLTELQRKTLKEMYTVFLISIPDSDVVPVWPGYFLPGYGCAWKCWLLWYLVHQFPPGDLVLYLDAGIVIKRELTELFSCISETGIFLVEDLNQQNGTWTTLEMAQEMKMTQQEASGNQLCAGIIGFQTQKHLSFFDEAYRLSLNELLFTGNIGFPKITQKYLFMGEHFGMKIKGTRWDQSLYSLLRLRHGFSGKNMEEYAEYRYGMMDNGCFLFVHRDKYRCPYTNPKKIFPNFEEFVYSDDEETVRKGVREGKTFLSTWRVTDFPPGYERRTYPGWTIFLKI